MMLTQNELHALSEMLTYLNNECSPKYCPLSFDLTVGDSNGEPVGKISWGGDTYVWTTS